MVCAGIDDEIVVNVYTMHSSDWGSLCTRANYTRGLAKTNERPSVLEGKVKRRGMGNET